MSRKGGEIVKSDLWIRITLSAMAILLAILRWVFFDLTSKRMDATFLLLVASAVLILVLPWERLKSLKAGGVELTLDQPQVKGAIEGLGLDRVEDKQLRDKLSNLAPEIEKVKGSRVLWIDDRPHTILGERRLFRALGIEVVTATLSEMAEEILQRDNDFDLIISDVQRKGESYKLNNGVEIHEGVNFIVKLRNHYEDPIIKSLPIIFYAAYPWDRLVKFTRPARELLPEAEISNTIEMLLTKAITRLSAVRTSPIVCSKKKTPTSVA